MNDKVSLPQFGGENGHGFLESVKELKAKVSQLEAREARYKARLYQKEGNSDGVRLIREGCLERNTNKWSGSTQLHIGKSVMETPWHIMAMRMLTHASI